MSTPRRKRPAKKPAVPAVVSKRDPLADDIRQMIDVARQQMAQAVNAGLTVLHWRIGNRIHREILGEKRANYGAEIVSALSRQLAWSHFKEIIYLKDELQRGFYAEMCRIERWSVRTLRQKVDGMLYERTALSKKPELLIRKELAELRTEDKLTPAIGVI